MLSFGRADFTVDLARSSTKTVGRDFTTTSILLVNWFNSIYCETKEGESNLYSRLRSKVQIKFAEMRAYGRSEDTSTLTFIGGTWRWDDWSLGSYYIPIRMERGRGASVIRARKTFSSGIEGNKAWEVPTPIGLEIDPLYLELWAELLDKHSLQPKLFTRGSEHCSN